MRFGVPRQVADAVAAPDGETLIAVVQRSASCHRNQDLLLEQMSVPSRRPAPWAHCLDGEADRGASERAADVGDLRGD
jgi:hypothetical protein